MSEKIKEYKKKPFPYISKSKLGDMKYCLYSYYVNRVLGEKEEDRDDAVEGSNLHMVFNNFYKTTKQLFEEKPEILFSEEMTDQKKELDYHPFRRFVYEGCMKFVKPDHRDWNKYKSIITYFATIETRRWLRLNSLLTNRREIMDCFLPIKVEEEIDIPGLHLNGTIDRIGVEVLPGGRKKICIYEYKTGSVPKVVRERVDDGNYLGWKIPTYASKEIHFYALLYLLAAGWNVSEEIFDFLENEDWWYLKSDDKSYSDVKDFKRKYLTKLGKKYKIFKEGKVLNANDFLVCYYYLNGGYRPIKTLSYASLKGVYGDINEYRSMEHNKAYTTHPRFVFNEFACERKKCGRLDKCREEMEKYYEEKKREDYL